MADFEVFNCYAHEDEKLRDELEKHMSSLRRRGVISSWHDRKISPGKEWEGQIDEHINSAHIILLLISPDFMASDYCYDKEMTRAMERHEAKEARVIPVILRPVDWNDSPFGKLQALPTDAEPITKWDNQDEAFLDVVSGVKSVCEELALQAKDAASAGADSTDSTTADKYISDRMSIVLSDDFETSFNWEQYLEGEVSRSTDFAHQGQYSLKKDKKNDPHGGYQTFENTIFGGFIFSGWLYRPSEGMRGVAERLAIEDDNGMGYGFCVSHKINGNVVYAIELRENGLCTENIGNVVAMRNDPLKDNWYYFYFQRNRDGLITLSIDVADHRLLVITGQHARYHYFNRVSIHGGHPYYVDDIQLIAI